MNVTELREAVSRLPTLPDDGTIWNHHRRSMQEHIILDDPRRMLKWSTIQATMFVADAPYIEHEMRELVATDWGRWEKAIEENAFGTPTRHPKYEHTSGNLIHQAYHLSRWETLTKCPIQDVRSIYEFGGGYGAMAKVARGAGFNDYYMIGDFPEMSLIQRYYLENVGIKDVQITSGLLPHNVDLFIACYSLSEMSIEARERFMSSITSYSYLFAFQHQWDGIDNREWFEKVAREHPDHQWHFEQAEHIKIPGATHWYLMGFGG